MQDPDVDTIDRMVVRDPQREAVPDDVVRVPPLLVIAVIVIGLLGIGAASVVDLPYVVLEPGDATPVGGLVQVPQDRAQPASGAILFTTVRLGPARIGDALAAWLDPDTELVPAEQFFPPDTSNDEFRELNLQLMQSSERVATVVALRKLGFEVRERGSGALITRVVDGAPADGRLRQGDLVVSLDGEPVRLADDLTRLVQSRPPGTVIRLRVQDTDGGARDVEVTLGRREQGEGGFLGVETLTKDFAYDLPFAIDIDTGRVGGPSAGLAFTLALLDVLTPGELTGGKRIAVTGTIDVNGRVGEVGGVAQKTAAVRESGAELFLVPPGEFETARRRAGDGVEVVRVATLDDALAALARVGGDVSALGPVAGGARR